MQTQNNNFGKNLKKIPVKIYTDKQFATDSEEYQFIEDTEFKENATKTRFQKIIDTIHDVKREIETSDEKVGKPKTHNYNKKSKNKTIYNPKFANKNELEVNKKQDMQNYNIEQDFEDIEKDLQEAKEIVKKKKILWICVGFGSLIIITSWISILIYMDFFKVNLSDLENNNLNKTGVFEIKENYNKFTEIIDTLKTNVNNNSTEIQKIEEIKSTDLIIE